MAAVIAAPASGSGKTLLSLALLSWAQQNGRRFQAFKVGPDYLDAQLLSQASPRAVRRASSKRLTIGGNSAAASGSSCTASRCKAKSSGRAAPTLMV